VHYSLGHFGAGKKAYCHIRFSDGRNPRVRKSNFVVTSLSPTFADRDVLLLRIAGMVLLLFSTAPALFNYQMTMVYGDPGPLHAVVLAARPAQAHFADLVARATCTLAMQSRRAYDLCTI
jgi:hypothetical protein